MSGLSPCISQVCLPDFDSESVTMGVLVSCARHIETNVVSAIPSPMAIVSS